MSGGKKPAQRRDVIELVCQVENLRADVTALRDDVRSVREIAARTGAAIGNGQALAKRLLAAIERIEASDELDERHERATPVPAVAEASAHEQDMPF